MGFVVMHKTRQKRCNYYVPVGKPAGEICKIVFDFA